MKKRMSKTYVSADLKKALQNEKRHLRDLEKRKKRKKRKRITMYEASQSILHKMLK